MATAGASPAMTLLAPQPEAPDIPAQKAAFLRTALRQILYDRSLVGVVLVSAGLLVLVLALAMGPTAGLASLGLIAGGTLIVAAVIRPTVALLSLIVALFSNVGEVVSIHGVFAGLVGMGALSAILALRKPEARERVRIAPFGMLGLFVVYLAAAVPAATLSLSPSDSWPVLQARLNEVVLLAVILLLAAIVDRPWLIAATVVLTIAFLALLTIVNQVFFGAAPSIFGGFATVTTALGELVLTPRHSGPFTDANFWGRVLVLGMPLACALVHRSVAARRPYVAIGYLTAILAMLGGIYLTQSRGTFMATLFAVGVWAVASGPTVRRKALMATPLLIVLLAVPGVGNRLIDLASSFEPEASYSVDPSVLGREAAQQTALIAFENRPVFGVGQGIFDKVVYDYAGQMGQLDLGIGLAPHNLYLEIAAETGVVGLAGFFVLIGYVCVIAVRSVIATAGWRTDGHLGAPTRALAAGAFASLLGWLFASIFLHLAYFSLVQIIILLVGLVGKRIRTCIDAAIVPSASSCASAALRRAMIFAAAIGTMVSISCGLLLVVSAQREYEASSSYVLLPAANIYRGYALDIRSREPVVPDYGLVLQSDQPRGTVTVEPRPARGIITIKAVGASEAAAVDNLRTAMEKVPGTMRRYRLDLQYELGMVDPPTVVSRLYDAGSAWTEVTALALVEIVVGVLVYRRVWGRRT